MVVLKRARLFLVSKIQSTLKNHLQKLSRQTLAFIIELVLLPGSFLKMICLCLLNFWHKKACKKLAFHLGSTGLIRLIALTTNLQPWCGFSGAQLYWSAYTAVLTFCWILHICLEPHGRKCQRIGLHHAMSLMSMVYFGERWFVNNDHSSHYSILLFFLQGGLATARDKIVCSTESWNIPLVWSAFPLTKWQFLNRDNDDGSCTDYKQAIRHCFYLTLE